MDDIKTFGPIWEAWEIDEKLGEGAYGTVWKAHHQESEQTFYSAIKHISIPKQKDEYTILREEGIITSEKSAKVYFETLLKNLMDEINLMSSLRGNKHIVSYEDHRIIPKSDGIGYDLFIRMELLQSVSSLIKQRNLYRGDVIKLGKDISEAIMLLNRNNIVHRDIKPQNLFVNKEGDYKLGDYGTARVLERTATAMSKKGTYSYMAPEIYKGEAANKTVDIYSLGIVMYRLMNGNRQPFLPAVGTIASSDTEEAIMKRISGIPLPPPAFADPAFAKLILKACAYQPEDRYQTGEELYQALDHLYDETTDDSISLFTTGLSEEPSDKKEIISDQKTDDTSKAQQTIKKAELPKGTKKRKRKGARKNRIFGGIATFIFAIMIGTGLYYGIGAIILHYATTSVVPDVVGYDVTEATQMISNIGADTQIQEVSSDEYKSGVVIMQLPAARETIKKGDIIMLVVSTGPKKLEMPSLIGYNSTDAMSQLTGMGITRITLERIVTNEYALDIVISSQPKPGSQIDKDTEVTLSISGGATIVPSLVNMTLEEAESALFNNQLTLSPTLNYTDTVDDTLHGLVAQQSPEANTRQILSTAITLSLFRCTEAGRNEVIKFSVPEDIIDIDVKITIQANESINELIVATFTCLQDSIQRDYQVTVPIPDNRSYVCTVYLDNVMYQRFIFEAFGLI